MLVNKKKHNQHINDNNCITKSKKARLTFFSGILD